MDYIIPITVLTVIGLIAAIMLVSASTFFKVKSDKKFDEVRACLPGINCSVCGYANCDGYAKGILDGDILTKCRPGGKKTADRLAEVMGKKPEERTVDRVAQVERAAGDTEEKAIYDGVKTCAAGNLVNKGQKEAASACLGYGDCERVCRYDAIYIENSIAKIDTEKCTGCGECIGSCPKSIIRMVSRINDFTD